MKRSAILACAVLLSGVLGQAGAQEVATMQPGQRLQLGPIVGERTVRQVMIAEGGGGIEIVYDMGPGSTQSQRVLRLENVNGMLEVVYDTKSAGMSTVRGGTPRLVTQGGGMYSVEYDR
jgi:hypothetical protein